MKIGELARHTGCPVETIRYYEREGLLPAPARSASNYRLYGQAHVERLGFIRHCRVLDMSHEEIRQLLALRDDPQSPCDSVNDLIDAHIGHVETQMASLQALHQQLVELRHRCSGHNDTGHCGILNELEKRDPVSGGPSRLHPLS
ncbi:Cd(II)/Pb(II)-responsive transcriptional regulator [Pseudomonas jilinensis]|uniref:Cd(II)/Pb(II)-responsive transcriptional regulator n=1 Tax=Pseudomonas jilinensis TaxID=2078689 RepID=A0A396S4J8_9PSED|nr:Cd(II)/Pb(II)-responsive transcriptional regulator [Pseudomonas jilinensis]RHW21011.1 Cd(II)/Pb(II)-responsive transcriptional regulator [Pseudomonas jilinensis]